MMQRFQDVAVKGEEKSFDDDVGWDAEVEG